MHTLGSLLVGLGVVLGSLVGVALLLGIEVPGLPWLVAVGLVKLTLIGAGGLIASGAILQRLARRADERERLNS